MLARLAETGEKGERDMTNGEKFKKVFGFGADGSRVIAVNAIWWDCDFQIRKPKTNADRIRSMTDEELATFCSRICDSYYKSYQYWLDWLKGTK